MVLNIPPYGVPPLLTLCLNLFLVQEMESNKRRKLTQIDQAAPGSHAPPSRALVVGDGAFASEFVCLLVGSLLAFTLRSQTCRLFSVAMATAMARRGSSVRILCHTTKVRDEINAGENKTYLPGHMVHENIKAYTSIEEACAPDVQLVLLVIPTQFLRKFLVANLSSMPVGCPIVVCAKVRLVACIQSVTVPDDASNAYFLNPSPLQLICGSSPGH